jgi:Flp pilus assembly pilin Flp
MFDGTYSPREVGSGSQPKHEKGQGLVEYALILALVSIAVIVILIMVGPAITQYFMDTKCTLEWKNSGRAFTAASAPGANASGEWRTDSYKFILSDYMNGQAVWCGLQNRAKRQASVSD